MRSECRGRGCMVKEESSVEDGVVEGEGMERRSVVEERKSGRGNQVWTKWNGEW